MNKKFISALFVSVFLLNLFNFTTFSTESNTEYEWYCERNGQKQPKSNKYESLIARYDGYYIDRRVNDADDKKILYLTFDCGYENGNVEKILDAMKKEDVKGAFFLLDNIIVKNPDLVTRMSNEGHTVCNHTKNHKNISNYTIEETEKNLSSIELLYNEITGENMAKYFRFPEGRFSENALKNVQSLGYKTIFWSFAYEDWDNSRQLSAAMAKKKILNNTHNGAVMLFHPTSRVNAEIFPQLIKEWKKMGYEFGTLNELCG